MVDPGADQTTGPKQVLMAWGEELRLLVGAWDLVDAWKEGDLESSQCFAAPWPVAESCVHLLMALQPGLAEDSRPLLLIVANSR